MSSGGRGGGQGGLPEVQLASQPRPQTQPAGLLIEAKQANLLMNSLKKYLRAYYVPEPGRSGDRAVSKTFMRRWSGDKDEKCIT